jgi:hypothetical protein
MQDNTVGSNLSGLKIHLKLPVWDKIARAGSLVILLFFCCIKLKLDKKKAYPSYVDMLQNSY